MICKATICRVLRQSRRLHAVLILCSLQNLPLQAASAQSDTKHTWGFVTARIDSRLSQYIYTGYGYDAVFLVGALAANPRSGYSEQILGAGIRLPLYRYLSHLTAIAFCNATDSRYTQLYYVPSLSVGVVSAKATVEAYFPLDTAGVKQFAISGLSVTARVGGPVAAGMVYELSAAEHTSTSQAAGVVFRLALPGAELGIDALRGIAHQQDHARVSFRAFY